MLRSSTYQDRPRLLLVVITLASTALALVAAVIAYGTVKPVAAAATHIFVDSPSPSVVHRPGYPFGALIERGELLGRVVTSPPHAEHVARLAGVPPGQLGTYARTTAAVPAMFREPASEERADQISVADRPYRLEVEARTSTPVLDLYARAPTVDQARRILSAAVADLEGWLRTTADKERVPTDQRVVLRQLGAPRGGPINGGLAPAVGVVTYLLVFASIFVLLRFLTRGLRPPRRERAPEPSGDAWPRTGRLTPWALAVFVAMVWLVPFDDIHLKVQMPIDLGFDRLVLPLVIATWVMAAIVGGAAAPRLRVTPIHLAVAAFVLCAFLSVIFNARELNESLELQMALKQLPLLISYVFLFIIASTSIRSNEVNAFLTYTLVLGVLCALGVLYEYRFKHNLFYDWSDKLLPGIFEVGKADSAAVDDIGRRVVRGPAIVPLETVAMLGMALGIPIARLTKSNDTRMRIVYSLCAALLIAAAFCTNRKSALLGPIAVVLTIAYFRRRELLKLSPLALAVVASLPVLAPGAVGMTATQFEPSRLGVATVSDRTADYDAIRPDVWAHFLFGKGWGSYDPVSYRILDSEILHRLVEMGVVGLLSFLGMVVAVVWTARITIASRDPVWSPPALVGTAAAMSFATMATLFDELAFPHDVYIFLYMAGLVAVVVGRRKVEVRVPGDGRHRLTLVRPEPPEGALESDAARPESVHV